jgi:hypothetical protein
MMTASGVGIKRHQNQPNLTTIGIHPERRHPSPQFIVECHFARRAAYRELNVLILLMQRNSRSV